MKLQGNTVLITGGSTGIGAAMAEAFLESGNAVIICARREERLRKIREQHPEIVTIVCDVAVAGQRTALFDRMQREFPNLNVLVNNAGIQRDIDFKSGIDDYLRGESEIRINLEAPIILSGLFIPFLAGKPNAAMVNVTSGLGFIPSARTPVYSATKAAMHAFSLALRRQIAATGIKVYEVIPPAVDTDLNAESRARRGYKPELQPKEFVDTVMQGLLKDMPEIGYGMTADLIHASRAELDAGFEKMNAGWK